MSIAAILEDGELHFVPENNSIKKGHSNIFNPVVERFCNMSHEEQMNFIWTAGGMFDEEGNINTSS